MQVLRTTSIRARLMLIMMAVSGIAVLLTALIITLFGIYHLQETMKEELYLSAAVVGDRNAAALIFNNPERAQDNLAVFEDRLSVQKVCLYRDGIEFARFARTSEKTSSECPLIEHNVAAVRDGNLIAFRDINVQGDLAGHIYIESDLSEIQNYIKRQFGTTLIVMVGMWLFSYILSLILQQSISRPILHLADTASNVTQFKDYSVRAKTEGVKSSGQHNEIAMLTHTFNTMLSEIEERDSSLRAQNIQLEKAKVAAESANKTKSEFLANISHELRTPLNAIIGFSDVMIQELFGKIGATQYRDYAQDINDSGNHLLHIINDILDLSKAEAGALSFHEDLVHVKKVILSCIHLVQERADQGDITLANKIDDELPYVYSDPHRFKQIILNLLSNAVKFTPAKGRVEVSTQLMETAGPDEYALAIIIRDNGIGMSADDLEKAMQYFGQIDSGLNRKYEGTGLGLPLARELAEMHQGELRIDSEPGVGTTVTFFLPAARMRYPEHH